MARKCSVGFRKVRNKCVRVPGGMSNGQAASLGAFAARLENKRTKPAEVFLIIRAQGTNRIAALEAEGSTFIIGGPIQPGEEPEIALANYAAFGGWHIKGTLKYVVTQRQRYEEGIGPKGELIPAAAGLAIIKTWYVITDGEATMRASWDGQRSNPKVSPTTVAVEDLWRIGAGNENASVLKVADDLARAYTVKTARAQAAQRGKQELPFIPPPSVYTVEPESSYVIPEVESARDAYYNEAHGVDVVGREGREHEESETSDIYSMTPERLLERGDEVARSGYTKAGVSIRPRIYTKEEVAAERAAAEKRLAEEEAAEAARKATPGVLKRKMARDIKAAAAPKKEAPPTGTLAPYADNLVFPVGEKASSKKSAESTYGYAPHISKTELVFVIDEPELMPLTMEVRGKTFNRFKVDPVRRMAFYLLQGAKPVVGLQGLGAEDEGYTVGRKPMAVVATQGRNLLARAMGAPKKTTGVQVVRKGAQESEPAVPAPVVIDSGSITPVRALAPAVMESVTPVMPATPSYEPPEVKAAYGERERIKQRRAMSEEQLAPLMVGSDVLGETNITRYYRTTSTSLYPAKFIGSVKGHLVEFIRSHEMTVSVNGEPTQVYAYVAPRPDVVRAIPRPTHTLSPAAMVTDVPTTIRPQGSNWLPAPEPSVREENLERIKSFVNDPDMMKAGVFVPDLHATWSRDGAHLVSSFRVSPEAIASGAVSLTYPGRPTPLLFIDHAFSAKKDKAIPLVFRHFKLQRQVNFSGRLQDGLAIEGFVLNEDVRAVRPNRPIMPVQWKKQGTSDYREGFLKVDYATAVALQTWMSKLANAQLGKLPRRGL